MSTIGKKFGQFRQWTGEKLGRAEKTAASTDFRQLELETESRKEGIDRMVTTLNDYLKTLEKRSSADKKMTTTAALSRALIQQGKFHGEESSYGIALQKIGEAEERIQGFQAELANVARQGLYRELATLHSSIKDYNSLRKKLENRRLDYDAKLNKLNKSRKERPTLEEEMKTSQVKYQETLADVETLMSAFAEREEALLSPLIEFSHAQCQYYRRALQSMEQLEALLTEEHLEEMRIKAEGRNKTTVGRRDSRLKTILPAETSTSTSSTSQSHRASLRESEKNRDMIRPKEGDYWEEKERETDRDSQSLSAQSNSRPQSCELFLENAAPVIPSENPPISRSSSLRTSNTLRRSVSSRSGETLQQQVEALYSFQAENEDEMSISKGDIVTVLQKIDEGWWVGECANGRSGLFPANYVRPLNKTAPENNRKATPERPVPKTKLPTLSTNKREQAQMASGMAGQDMSPPKPIPTLGSNNKTHAASSSTCGECGCGDFTPNPFKPGQCTNCFHRH